MTAFRIGVASIIQETNTFSPIRSTLDDFEGQGLLEGELAREALAGTNTELAGAVDELERQGAMPVPLIRAWAMSGGPLQHEALTELRARLRRQVERVAPLDALVLSLHGALAADGVDDADLALLRAARAALYFF